MKRFLMWRDVKIRLLKQRMGKNGERGKQKNMEMKGGKIDKGESVREKERRKGERNRDWLNHRNGGCVGWIASFCSEHTEHDTLWNGLAGRICHVVSRLTRKTKQPINCFWTFVAYRRSRNAAIGIENTSSARARIVTPRSFLIIARSTSGMHAHTETVFEKPSCKRNE